MSRFSQQNEPAAKRTRTSLPSEPTAEHSEIPATNPEQTTQTAVDDAELFNDPDQGLRPYRSDAELANILSGAIREIDEQGKRTTK